ncbi:hypothetical protein [Halorubrum laminariae]|uniref:Cox cluster protein n=1 Tax=Halorubrum laminariae TaxID=1433523 RepID=A0ABD6C6E8_9EURY|nr:hypothetical protein [Halorubrum laminariae]
MADRVDLNRLKSTSVLLALGATGLLLLILSFIIEVQIIFENPPFGDVTGFLGGIWSLLLAIATLGSFALAVHNYRHDDDPSGPSMQFSVRGRNNDVDYHVHIGGSDDSDESAQQEDEENNEGPRPDSVSEYEEAGDSEER